MARIAVIKESLDKALRDESKPWTNIFAIAEKKIGVDRLYIFLASVGFLALYLVVGIGQQLVCNIIGFLYPAYCSMKALESPQKDDDTKWLTYWVVFAVFTIIEFFADYIVFWLPIYWLIKCLFYVWLMVPIEYNGSLIIYRRVIRPKFLQYQPNLDAIISNARNSAVKMAADVLTNEKKD
ncbi:receptor expression-enhancing protein 5-like isoform X1 [Diprion similis]|uniref:receptor expression-enhancing protein 5-like isoform X1 n=1 Tax=Diprion similis TaxID=362088 RepID=UPI001EF87723|nr:receptor expression-enhancing protein 5-like isoform X1 [Diprion similis]